jgi:hypothetical protein
MADNSEKNPVTLKGELSHPPGRALWLIKWLILVPHIFILVFLWIAFVFVTLIAFFAILFTGRYPKGLFDFNVGVLRWTWRVGFYGYQALATNEYPPFSLKSSDYPADLDIEYPESLTQWLVLFKWFLAIPHFAVLFFLTGAGGSSPGFPHGGLLSVLVLIVAIVLLFTGKYHRDIFRIVMGINRWIYRVIAYVALMTDEYPPFKLWE